MSPDELRRWIDEHRMSATELSRELGVSASTTNRWVRGQSPIPRWLGLALEGLDARRRRERTQR